MGENLDIRKGISFVIILAFLANNLGITPLYAESAQQGMVAQAQSASPVEGDFRLPAPGVLVHLSPPLEPPILKGIKVHSDNPFRFDFILDKGDSPSLVKEGDRGSLKQQATQLIKYFLASLTIPEKDLWVNLSPYEKDRIIPQSFGLTEMGRDLLAEDYMLKQITASLIYPEDKIGKKFWKRIYEEAAKKFGETDIPVNTFNKVWIVPEKAVVYENAKAGTAYVVESKLKVMLEEDYLSMSKHADVGVTECQPGGSSARQNYRQAGCQASQGLNAKAPQVNNSSTNEDVNVLGSQIIREIVIPELTREVNEDKNFAQLRQVYNSLILATWYKKKIKDSILAQVYADKKKIKGVGYDQSIIQPLPTRGHVPEGYVSPSTLPSELGLNARAPQGNPVNDVELIYQRYLRAFKKGVYNYIKEDQDPITQQIIPRKYFSGGLDMAMTTSHYGLDQAALSIVHDPRQALADGLSNNEVVVKVDTVLADQTVESSGHNITGAMSTGPEEIKDSAMLNQDLSSRLQDLIIKMQKSTLTQLNGFPKVSFTEAFNRFSQAGTQMIGTLYRLNTTPTMGQLQKLINFNGEIIVGHIRGTSQWVMFLQELGEKRVLMPPPRAYQTVMFWRKMLHFDLIDIHLHNHPLGICPYPSLQDAFLAAQFGGRTFLLTGRRGIIEFDGSGLTDLNGHYVWPEYYDNVAYQILKESPDLENPQISEMDRERRHYEYYKKINFMVKAHPWTGIFNNIFSVGQGDIASDLNDLTLPQKRLRGLARVSNLFVVQDDLYLSILGYFAKHEVDSNARLLAVRELQKFAGFKMDSRSVIAKRVMRDMGIPENENGSQLAGNRDRAMINEEAPNEDARMMRYYRDHEYYESVPVLLHKIREGKEDEIVQVDHFPLTKIFSSFEFQASEFASSGQLYKLVNVVKGITGDKRIPKGINRLTWINLMVRHVLGEKLLTMKRNGQLPPEAAAIIPLWATALSPEKIRSILEIIAPRATPKMQIKGGLAGRLGITQIPGGPEMLYWKPGQRNKWAMEANEKVNQRCPIPRKKSDWVSFEGKDAVQVTVSEGVYLIGVQDGEIIISFHDPEEKEFHRVYEDKHFKLERKYEIRHLFRIRVDPIEGGRYRMYFRSRVEPAILEWTAVPDTSDILGVFKEPGEKKRTWGNVDWMNGLSTFVSGSGFVIPKGVYNIIGKHISSELGKWKQAKAYFSRQEVESFLQEAVQEGVSHIGDYGVANPNANITTVNINVAGVWQDKQGHQFVTIVHNKSMNRIYILKKSGQLIAQDKSKEISEGIESIEIPVEEGDSVIMTTSVIPELTSVAIPENDSPEDIAEEILSKPKNKHKDGVYPGVVVLRILDNYMLDKKEDRAQLGRQSVDEAMKGQDNGGIDLTPAKMNLQTKIDSSPAAQNDKGIVFHLDPAQLAQLQNASGFVPVIINIQPMTDLRQFLGL